MNVVDLFAGPGGWDVAARDLGLDPLGIEFDDAACATRKAAGLRTKQADVAALDPTAFAPCDLLIASPPCQSFSRAGKREGVEDLPLVWEAAKLVRTGNTFEGLRWRDPRSELVLEPLRWALALEPDFLAFEQVPDVLSFWRLCAEILGEHGWQTWTGHLTAERYGVPQTRERAILMASRGGGHLEPPPPTHQRYVKGVPAQGEATLEGEILPWVSMAQALGWDEKDEVGFPRADDTGREAYRERDRRPASEPAFTMGEKVRSWDRVRTDNVTANGTEKFKRPTEAPAPTLTSRVDLWSVHDGRPGSGYPCQQDGAIRVTLEEAAVLQTFPSSYPFQGSRSKCFEQVGNAVPPVLAEAILSTLLAEALP